MPRLVRRRSLAERISDYLNPQDWMMWISEELETSDYPWDEWAYTIGAGMNLVFVISRSNVSSKANDDVFSDSMSSGGGFFGPLASLLVLSLTIFSLTNAAYTFLRRRPYRLFETPVEGKAPSTPSAHRVRVDSSPASSSPFRLLTSIFESSSAQSRAHPDATRDVWEISVWDPTALNLKLFCAFSPGHVILYYFFLPVSPADPRPSTTVAVALALAGLMSLQLGFLQRSFTQQTKDASIVQREVMNEYNAKFVHPLAMPLVRNVGTQFDDDEHTFDACEAERPAVVVRRGFKTHANPNYAKYVDPDGATMAGRETPAQTPMSRLDALRTPATRNSISPSQRMAESKAAGMQAYRASMGATPDAGHLGVYSHSRSPLKDPTASRLVGGAASRHSTQGIPSKRSGYVSTATGPARSRF